MTAQYGPMLGFFCADQSTGVIRPPVHFTKPFSEATVPVPIFRIDNRRGSFALTRDVALWLSRKRAQAIPAAERNSGGLVGEK